MSCSFVPIRTGSPNELSAALGRGRQSKRKRKSSTASETTNALIERSHEMHPVPSGDPRTCARDTACLQFPLFDPTAAHQKDEWPLGTATQGGRTGRIGYPGSRRNRRSSRPPSGYGAPRYAGSSRARIVLLSLLVRMSRARGRLGRGSSRERSDACRGQAFRVLAAYEHLERVPERELGRERFVNDGVDDHTPETVSGTFLSQRLSEHSDLLSELIVLERIAAFDG